MQRNTDGRRPRLPSPGLILGLVALAVALGGTAMANLPGNNSVISSDIKNNNVRSPDIKSNAVKQSEIAANAVGQSEVGTDAVGADELKATWIVGSGETVNANSADSATATCPVGSQVISGGFTWDIDAAGLFVVSLELSTGGNSATVTGYNDTGSNRTLSARVYCIVL